MCEISSSHSWVKWLQEEVQLIWQLVRAVALTWRQNAVEPAADSTWRQNAVEPAADSTCHIIIIRCHRSQLHSVRAAKNELIQRILPAHRALEPPPSARQLLLGYGKW